MSKFLKVILVTVYTFLLVQYINISLKSNYDKIELFYLSSQTEEVKSMKNLLKLHKDNVTVLKSLFKRLKRFPTDLKFILRHSDTYGSKTSSLDIHGQEPFIRNNCKYVNCFLTNNENLLYDVRHYDAILFYIEHNWVGTLALREPHQTYIFVANQAAGSYELCDRQYNNYYNLTMSYKLDSDIPWTYIRIVDKLGITVGPRVNMTWMEPMDVIPERVKSKIAHKKKAAAWFVSNCDTKNNRRAVAEDIQNELLKLGHVVDIYGWCGKRTCPQNRFQDCLYLLESDYYFYLSFENVFSEDFVTEALLYPMQYYTVPVVYGGADYSRFLPPNSYIDARKLNATEVAKEMVRAIKNSTAYENYFRWHNYYTYVDNRETPDVCKLCQMLNENTNKSSTTENFLDWWNEKDYRLNCANGKGIFMLKNKLLLEPFKMYGWAE